VPLNGILTTHSRPPSLRAPPYKAAPNQSSLYCAAAHGGFSAAPQSKGGEEGRRRWRRGRSWGPLWCVDCDVVLEPPCRRS
jgi:hypothetical protein